MRRHIKYGDFYFGQVWDAEALTLIAAMTSQPTSSRKVVINDFFRNYKSQSGITSLSSHFDFLAFTAAHDAQAAKLWWNNPATSMTLGGVSPTFTADRGYKNSGNGYVNTLFNPSTGTNFTQSDSSIFIYLRDNVAEANYDFGIVNATTVAALISRNTTNVTNGTVNAGSSISPSPSTTDSRGLWHIRRVSSTITKIYHNGILVGEGTSASLTRCNGNLYALCLNDLTGSPTLFSTKQVAFIGAGSSAIDPVILYNNVQDYMRSVGAQVLDYDFVGDAFNSDTDTAVMQASRWTTQGTGTAWSWDGSTIDSQGTGGTYSSLVRYNAWSTQAENFKIKARVKINSSAASDVYFGVGLTGTSSLSQNTFIICAFWAQSGSFKGYQEIYYNSTTNIVANSGANRLSFSVNDVIEYEIVQNNLSTYFTVRNITNPGGDQTIGWINTNALISPGTTNTNLFNINQLALYNYKGSYTVQQVSYTINEAINPKVVVVGDSKSEGYYVQYLSNRYSNKLAAAIDLPVVVAAGSGNVTQDILNSIGEIINYAPEKVILCIGRNDLANSIPSGTWQANYASIVSQLQAAGITVYHQLPLTEATLDQSALTTYINATYPGANVIPVPTGWSTGTDCSADGVHLTTAGTTKIANTQQPYI